MSGDNRIFAWDAAKSEACLLERGFDFAYAARVFDGPVHERMDDRLPYGEDRMQAIGRIEGSLFVVVFVQCGEKTRIISARRAHQKE